MCQNEFLHLMPPFAGGKPATGIEACLGGETGSCLASLGNNFCFPFLVLVTFLLLYLNTQPKQLVEERIYLGPTVLEGYNA